MLKLASLIVVFTKKWYAIWRIQYYFWFWDESGRIPRKKILEARIFIFVGASVPWIPVLRKIEVSRSSTIILHKSARNHGSAALFILNLFMSIIPTIWKKKEVSLSTSRMARLPQALSPERHAVSIPGIVKSAQLSELKIVPESVYLRFIHQKKIRYLKWRLWTLPYSQLL